MAYIVGQKMKTFATYWIVLMLTVPRLGAEVPKNDDRADNPRLEQTDDKTKRVIAQLEGIKIDNVSFEKLTTSEAMDYLTQKVVGEKGGGVINFVIRGGDLAHRIGIKRKGLNFAQAVDEICRQSGRVWMIDFNEASGAPVLIIKNKKGQQDAPSNGGQRSSLNSGFHPRRG
jgi:hypothetical protein